MYAELTSHSGHFGDEPCQTIKCTATDNKQQRQMLKPSTKQTQKLILVQTKHKTTRKVSKYKQGTAVLPDLAIMTTDAETPCGSIVFVHYLNVWHKPLNADEVRWVLKHHKRILFRKIISIV